MGFTYLDGTGEERGKGLEYFESDWETLFDDTWQVCIGVKRWILSFRGSSERIGVGGGGSHQTSTALNAGRLLTFKLETEPLAQLEISIKRSKVNLILRFFGGDKSECIPTECKYAGWQGAQLFITNTD